MRALVTLLTVCLVVFAYLHIVFQLKKNNDLEILELPAPDKDRLEEVCDSRQPTVFYHDVPALCERCNLSAMNQDYSAFDVKILDGDPDETIPLPLNLGESLRLFAKDDKAKYWTENNREFLEDTSLAKTFAANDALLRPHMVSGIQYDVMFGADKVTTRLAYNVNYRNYFMVTQGSVRLKLSPPKNSRYFSTIKNYELQEYYSALDPWNPGKDDAVNFGKAKFLDVTLDKGQVLYVPAYWWYSIQLSKSSCVAAFKYRTYMNTLAILPDILIGVLQRQNTKTKTIQEYGAGQDIA